MSVPDHSPAPLAPAPRTVHLTARRTVLRGAAWTAPALVATTVTPAFAASSGQPQLMVSFPDIPSDYREGHGPSFTCLVTNTGTVPVPGPVTLTIPIPDFSTLRSLSTADPDWTTDTGTDPATAQTTTDLAVGASVSFSLSWTANGDPVTFRASVQGRDAQGLHAISVAVPGYIPV